MAGELKGTRVIALVGPAGAGKTSLAESMLFAAGATDRLGSTANGSSIGDSSPEARSSKPPSSACSRRIARGSVTSSAPPEPGTPPRRRCLRR